MINFKVNGFSIYPTSVWYHLQKDNKSDSSIYQIKNFNEPDLFSFIEKTFEIDDLENENSLKKLMMANENHFSLVNILIKYLIKAQKHERTNIDWVFNSITKIAYLENELTIEGLASKYVPDYGQSHRKK